MPYSSPYPLPIPMTLQPSFAGQVPNVSFPDVNNSALFALAGGATQYFGLRFTGVWPHIVNLSKSGIEMSPGPELGKVGLPRGMLSRLHTGCKALACSGLVRCSAAYEQIGSQR